MNFPDMLEAKRRNNSKTEYVYLENNQCNLYENKKYYIRTYGCQMNVHDSENICALVESLGFTQTENFNDSDLIILNTCAIRENVHDKVIGFLGRCKHLKNIKKDLIIALCGCMAQEESVVKEIMSKHKYIDIVFGTHNMHEFTNMLINRKETTDINVYSINGNVYENIPYKRDSNITAWVNIMYGCDKFCTYCIVPYTRGRERSRNPKIIIDEVKGLADKGCKEITLLGQNVNSYDWKEGNNSYNFAQLIAKVADLSPFLRVRFATSHPKDISNELIQTIANYPNICSYIHLPFQSGSNNMLQRMNRGYTREYYIERIQTIRSIIPHCGLSTDIIAGFCGETESDHQDTLALMKEVVFDAAYMFKYSVRKGTKASKQFNDDVPENKKTTRLNEIITLQQQHSLESNQKEIGKTFEILVEGESKRSKEHFFGRTTSNKVAVFPKQNSEKGMYVQVKIKECTTATLIGDIV